MFKKVQKSSNASVYKGAFFVLKWLPMAKLSRSQKKVLLRRLYMLAQSSNATLRSVLDAAFVEASGDSLNDTVLTNSSANGASVGYALRQIGASISKAAAAEVYNEFIEMLDSLKPSIATDADKFAALNKLISESATTRFSPNFSGGRNL